MKEKELLTFWNFNLILQSATMTLYEDEGYGGKTLVRLKARSYMNAWNYCFFYAYKRDVF